ncbi:hypothetical protein ACFC14_05015 [Microbacterium sp. NPDC055988]|uniref:hypothetical protein n=1 Tax=Microbacterium sp. NPDC055988 TaxID=3345671 RepID=UPI0035E2CA06
MKRLQLSSIVLGCAFIVGAMAGATPAMAVETDDIAQFNSHAELVLKSQLDAAVSGKDLNASFGDVKIEADRDVIAHYGGDAEAYAADILTAFENDAAAEERVSLTPRAYYTSSVFAGVPAGGACWVKQDFAATVSNYRVTSKSLRGNSYQEGVCAFQWSPNYSWFEGSFNVLSKGTFHALIKGGPVSFAATFKAIYTVNKSSLTQHAQ